MKKTHLNSIVISVFILPACTLARVWPRTRQFLVRPD